LDLLIAGALALVLTLVLGAALTWIVEGHSFALPGSLAALVRTADGLAAGVSLLLSAAALALLPWPLHPAAGRAWVGEPLLIWAAAEGAFLAPLVPGLLAPSPLAARAVVREGQISLAGRVVVWVAVGAALWVGAGWSAAALPGRVLAALGGLLAMPAAAGIGPFAPERSLNLAGAEEGLDEQTARLIGFARAARAGVLLMGLTICSLPLASIAAPAALLLVLAVFVAVALGLKRIGAGQPRVTLPAALRWCWRRALPAAGVGLLYLAIV